VNNLGIIKTVSAATSEIIHISPESVIHIAGIRIEPVPSRIVPQIVHSARGINRRGRTLKLVY
jgi:hypothetical protein